MSTALIVLACVVAIVNLPSSAGLLAWGLAGGDGEAAHWYEGILAVLLFVAAVVAVGYSFGSFEGISTTRWMLMFVAPVTALVGIALVGMREREHPLEVVKLLWAPAALTIPPALVWAAGAVNG